MVDFLEEDDHTVFGTYGRDLQSTESGCLRDMGDLVNINVINTFPTLQQLHAYLDRLDLLDPEHLRPSWDSYFMVSDHVPVFSTFIKDVPQTLASLASRRSNCMKRRVGAVLVRQNRVLATGYNGTPRGLPNCNEGGCSHCNLTNKINLVTNECLCLHAEENALLEAGRERVGNDCVLYCNTYVLHYSGL
jgi:dCMP deaminase